jgi:cbb3-type cytochrome oxidase subunit 3
MKMINKKTFQNIGKTLVLVFSLFLLLINQHTQAQTVSSSIDSSSIQIGEQIKYKIEVETDTTNLVVFPEGQTFMPLENVEASAIDTTINQRNFKLLKEYALTQFDSGKYTIPRQRILINNKAFFTDSLLVEVRDVAVDTTKQKLYPVKPSIQVDKPFQVADWVWWLLITLVIIGGLVFLLWRRNKKKTEAAQKIPPFEKAMLTLKQLDESQQLESGQIKAYYSSLTEAIRRYIDEKIDDRALESTTAELVARLNALTQENKLRLSKEEITKLEEVLKRADLIKFAGFSMDKITAKSDRQTVEHNIFAFKEAIPEPTEEELLKDQAYREAVAKRRKRKTILISVVAGLAILVVSAIGFVGLKGWDYVQDNILGSPSKDLLKGEWIQSEYGNPAVSVITPKVLVRNMQQDTLPQAQTGAIIESFSYGSILGEYYINLSLVNFPEKKEFDLDKSIEAVYTDFENKGATNILMKNEEFTTVNGAEGIKIFGSFKIKNPVLQDRTIQKSYTILNFGYNGAFEQLMLVYEKDNAAAEEITNRIINSIELKIKEE